MTFSRREYTVITKCVCPAGQQDSRVLWLFINVKALRANGFL